MNILCIGDIVGKPGRQAIEMLLPDLKREYDIQFVIANGENSAGGSGITGRIADFLLNCGCDVITLGDHTWDQQGVGEYLQGSSSMIRPANFPQGVPGKGWCVVDIPSTGVKIGVINLLGRTFMRYNVDCPFRKAQSLVEEIRKTTPNIILDMHAETTSEKVAMGHFLTGKVSAIFGTHTHVQTSDEQILGQATAYITDLGMTGPHDSVIGQDKDIIIKRFLTSMPIKFYVAEGRIILNGVVVTIDEHSGKAQAIRRIQRAYNSGE